MADSSAGGARRQGRRGRRDRRAQGRSRGAAGRARRGGQGDQGAGRQRGRHRQAPAGRGRRASGRRGAEPGRRGSAPPAATRWPSSKRGSASSRWRPSASRSRSGCCSAACDGEPAPPAAAAAADAARAAARRRSGLAPTRPAAWRACAPMLIAARCMLLLAALRPSPSRHPTWRLPRRLDAAGRGRDRGPRPVPPGAALAALAVSRIDRAGERRPRPGRRLGTRAAAGCRVGRQIGAKPAAERPARRSRWASVRLARTPALAGSEVLDPRPQLDLPGPGAAVLPEDVQVGAGDRVGVEHRVRASGGSVRPGLRIAPSMTKWATWMPCGASSRAMLCASPRSANLPIANGADSL